MKKLQLFNTACVLIAVLFVQDSRAQNYAKWSLPDGAKVRLGKGGAYGGIAYSPDGTRLAVVSSVGIWIYDAYTGAETALGTGYPAYVESMAFAPDGKTLASVIADSTVRMWDAETGQLKNTLEHTARVESVAFSPDGTTLASTDYDMVRMWDAETGQLKNTLIGHTYPVFSVSFSLDGTTLASTDYDTVRMWDAETGQLKNTLIGHTVAVTLDGKIIAYADWETVQLWDASAQLKTTLDLEEHENSVSLLGDQSSVFSVTFSPDGKTIAGAGYDNTVWLWDAATGQLKNTLIGHTVVFSPDGTTLAIADRIFALRVWDGIIYTNADYNTVRLWDVATGQLKNTLIGHTDDVDSMVFSPDGKTIASASAYDGTVRMWDTETGQLKISLDHFNFVFSVAFSPDGKTLASAVGDKAVRMWDTETGQLKNTLEWHGGGVISVAFAPDGKTIASASAYDGIIQLWDVASGQLKNTMEGHTYRVESVAFSPDGTTLASVYYGTIRLWDVASGQLKNTMEGHTYYGLSAAFSPDGATLASSSGNGTILLWDMSPYITPSTPTAIELSQPLPTQTALLANYPNPFNPNTHIPYQLHTPAHVCLTIYDIRGALIREFDLGYQQAGQYLTSANAAHWDGRDQRDQLVASGVYLYQLQAGPVAHGRKMLLVK